MRHGAAMPRISRQHKKGTQCEFIVLHSRRALRSPPRECCPATPEKFGIFIKSEIAKYAKVVKAAGIHVE